MNPDETSVPPLSIRQMDAPTRPTGFDEIVHGPASGEGDVVPPNLGVTLLVTLIRPEPATPDDAKLSTAGGSTVNGVVANAPLALSLTVNT
jgi:hypothetical protein